VHLIAAVVTTTSAILSSIVMQNIDVLVWLTQIVMENVLERSVIIVVIG